MFIGKRVRELRQKNSMTLSELSQKSGVQIATLSRIEHMKMPGTLESHMKIAKALEVDVTQLYTDIVSQEQKVARGPVKTATDMFVGSQNASYEILTSKVLSKKMMPILLKIDPGGQTNPEQHPPGAEKFIYILDGTLTIIIGEDAFTLKKHNTLYFDASQTHYYKNTRTKAVKMIGVCTPVML